MFCLTTSSTANIRQAYSRRGQTYWSIAAIMRELSYSSFFKACSIILLLVSLWCSFSSKLRIFILHSASYVFATAAWFIRDSHCFVIASYLIRNWTLSTWFFVCCCCDSFATSVTALRRIFNSWETLRSFSSSNSVLYKAWRVSNSSFCVVCRVICPRNVHNS